jgi:hypothetical protein
MRINAAHGLFTYTLTPSPGRFLTLDTHIRFRFFSTRISIFNTRISIFNMSAHTVTSLKRWSCQDTQLPPVEQIKAIHVYDFDNTCNTLLPPRGEKNSL